MIYSVQIKAARVLIGWSQSDLADRAGVGIATVKRVEASEDIARGYASNIWRIQEELEKAGVTFIAATADAGPGVRLTHPKA